MMLRATILYFLLDFIYKAATAELTHGLPPPVQQLLDSSGTLLSFQLIFAKLPSLDPERPTPQTSRKL